MATITAALCLATGGGSVGEWMLPVRYCRSLPGRRRSRLPGHHHRFRDLEKIVVHDLKGRRKIWRALQGAERRGTADCCRRSGDETPGLSMRISFCFMRLGERRTKERGPLRPSAVGRAPQPPPTSASSALAVRPDLEEVHGQTFHLNPTQD